MTGVQDRPLIVLLNGPLGIGKSTLGEVLGEAIDRCATLDGDRLAALNPPPQDEMAYLHDTIALLVGHHRRCGYSRFVINHLWSSPDEISDLEARVRLVAPDAEFRSFRLTLPKEENERRIRQRQSTRAIDESEFEWRHFEQEYAQLASAGAELGETFDAGDAPEVLAERMLKLLKLPRSTHW